MFVCMSVSVHMFARLVLGSAVGYRNVIQPEALPLDLYPAHWSRCCGRRGGRQGGSTSNTTVARVCVGVVWRPTGHLGSSSSARGIKQRGGSCGGNGAIRLDSVCAFKHVKRDLPEFPARGVGVVVLLWHRPACATPPLLSHPS